MAQWTGDIRCGQTATAAQRGGIIQIYYTAGNGSITIHKVRGKRDNYSGTTYGNSSSNKIKIYIGGYSSEKRCDYIAFGGYSWLEWTDFEDYTVGLSGDQTVKIEITSNNNYQYVPVGSSWTTTINGGTSTFWNDINTWNPEQTSQNGVMFDLYTSENNSTRYNLTNEDTDMTHTNGTYFEIWNLRPQIAHTHVTSVSGHDSMNGSRYRKIFNAANECLDVYTDYNTYKVSYNANGGSSTPNAQSVKYPGSVNLASAISRGNSSSNSNVGITVKYNANGGNSTPGNGTGNAVNTTTTKYTFSQWGLNGTGGTKYNAGASYKPTANVTMYAVWNSSQSTARTSNPTIKTASAIARNNSTVSSYTVAYNANGGTSTPGTQTATKTRKYTFGGWNTNSSGTGTNYNAATNYTFSGNATLYAKWSSSDSGGSVTLANAIARNNSTLSSYTVSYNANGGSSTPGNQTATRTRKYTFSQWAAGSASGTKYNAGAGYTPSANTTMYATWNTSDSGGSITLPAAISRANGATAGYSITYNANGGSGAPGNQTSDNRTITYTFNKWAAGSTSGTQYAAGASYTPSANTTMYALWNSSTSNNSSWTCSNVKPTRTGYTFLGWSETAGANTAQYQAGQTYTITSTKTLYAVWQVNFYYIDVNGLLDGVGAGNITDFGKCDVYIDGVQVATQVTDYCVEWPYGTQYEIKNITPDWGVKYNGVTAGSLSGTLGTARVNIQLSFTRLPVTLAVNVDGEWKTGIMYVNVDGEWKKARALNIHHDGDWERLEKIDFTL